jgi:hypothetical protein
MPFQEDVPKNSYRQTFFTHTKDIGIRRIKEDRKNCLASRCPLHARRKYRDRITAVIRKKTGWNRERIIPRHNSDVQKRNR